MDANFGLVQRASSSNSKEAPKRDSLFLNDENVFEFVEAYNDSADMKELKKVLIIFTNSNLYNRNWN